MAKSPSKPTEFGVRLRELRTAKGKTLAEIGKAIGQDAAAISRMETSSQANPKLSTIKKLAEALGVKPADLIGE